MVDAPWQSKPRRVKKCKSEIEARDAARSMNNAAQAAGRPLYFVEYFDTTSVVDCCASEMKAVHYAGSESQLPTGGGHGPE
jgi:hypothetical protein